MSSDHNIEKEYIKSQARKIYPYIHSKQTTITGERKLSAFLAEDPKDRYKDVVRKCTDILDALHDSNIIYGLPIISNFRIDDKGNIWLIDFDYSYIGTENDAKAENDQLSRSIQMTLWTILSKSTKNSELHKWKEELKNSNYKGEDNELAILYKDYRIYFELRDIIRSNAKKLPEDLYEDLYKSIVKRASVKTKIDDIKHELIYQEGASISKATVHHGQLKLLLSEIQFLTDIGMKLDTNKIIVYAGAAPGNHIYELGKLFPKLKFVLVDPNDFALFLDDKKTTSRMQKTDDIIYLRKTNPRTSEPDNTANAPNVINSKSPKISKEEDIKWIIDYIKNSEYKFYLIQSYFDDNLAELLSALDPILISDIRTATGKNDKPTDLDILYNLGQQYHWVHLIKPDYALLKFRHPFYNDKSVDNITDQNILKTFEKLKTDYDLDMILRYKNEHMVYFNGEIKIQAYAPVSSTETRLLVQKKNNKYETINYGTRDEYENKMFYYNDMERGYLPHYNEYVNEDLGYDNCGDCSLASHIMEQYRSNVDKNYKFDLSLFTLYTGNVKNFFGDGHGYMYPDNYDLLKNLSKSAQK